MIDLRCFSISLQLDVVEYEYVSLVGKGSPQVKGHLLFGFMARLAKFVGGRSR